MDYLSAFVYKPKRILYYINPTEAQRADYLKGISPKVFAPYDGEYGTYCSPSLFIISGRECDMEVIGIEFRPGDEMINYPKDMDSIVLEPCFMVSSILPTPDYFDGIGLKENIPLIKKYIDNVSFHDGKIKVKKQPELVIVDTIKGSGKVYFEGEKVEADYFFDEPLLVTDNEKRFYNSTYRDGLTGHFNWNYIWQVIAGYGLKGIQDYAFVHFDVKDFKALNFVYGHDVANDVLSRIVDKINDRDWVYHSARCDNDNFAMMIKDMPIDETVSKLKSFFDEISVLTQDSNYHIYYRCGYVPMRNTLLLGDRVADAAKHVQRMGNKLYETEVTVYTDAMFEELDWSEKAKAYLDTAIENDEFLVYLQPKYDIRNNKLYGAEALIRWNYHNREILSPGRFIPVFETGGLISKIDDIVLDKVCGYLKKWKDEGKELYPISINLSRKSLGNHDLVRHLTDIVDAYGVEHSLIDFELTESSAYENQRYMIAVIKELKEKGFKISIDDFGTGYSSLSLLTVMPLDTLKIDKSFVDNIGDKEGNEKDKTVIKQIINMTKDLHFTCLAEGAEEKDQIDTLLEYGCEIVQGFYYSKPLPVEEYERNL